MGNILIDMMGLLSRKRVVKKYEDTDFIVLGRRPNPDDSMFNTPKMHNELISMKDLRSAFDVGEVTGSGTTGFLPVYTDGANSVIGDSQLRQGQLGNGLYQIRMENADRFIINKPSTVTGGDPEYTIQQDGQYKVSFGWDDDGDGFGFMYNYSGAGLKFGAAGNNPMLELKTTAGSEEIDLHKSVKLVDYGTGTQTGTVAYTLAVDSSGKVIETTDGGGTVTGTGDTDSLVKFTDGPNGVIGSVIGVIEQAGEVIFGPASGTRFDTEVLFDGGEVSSFQKFTMLDGAAIEFVDPAGPTTDVQLKSSPGSGALNIVGSVIFQNSAVINNATSSADGIIFNHPAGGSSSQVFMHYAGATAGSRFVISRSATAGAEIELEAGGNINLNRSSNGSVIVSQSSVTIPTGFEHKLMVQKDIGIFAQDSSGQSATMRVGFGGNPDSTNTAVGQDVLKSNVSGKHNVGVGRNALETISDTDNNVGVGEYALGLISGSDNTAVGYGAGYGRDGGTNGGNNIQSVYIGSRAIPGAASGGSSIATENQIVIGYETTGNGTNSATLGNDSIANTYLKGTVRLNSSAILPQFSYLYFGEDTNNQLSLYNSLSGASLKQTGTGTLEIACETDVLIRSNSGGIGGEALAKFTKDGSIELYYDNVKKFETTGNTIKISGVPVHADNAAATTAGLTVGEVYRTDDFLKIVH